MATMAWPKLYMILHDHKFEVVAANGTQGFKEIQPQGVSQGSDPPPEFKFFDLEYASVFMNFARALFFGIFGKGTPWSDYLKLGPWGLGALWMQLRTHIEPKGFWYSS